MWGYDITIPASERGSLVDESMETGFTSGVLVAPKLFPAQFVPRSKERSEVIGKEFEVADRFLSKFEYEV